MYDDENTFLEFLCEYEPGRLSQYYHALLEWRQIFPNNRGSRIVSGLPGFSANTDDFSLRVDLGMVSVSGSFVCEVEVPQCVVSLSSPDDIAGKCGESNVLGMLQKVPPNYCELVSVKLACESYRSLRKSTMHVVACQHKCPKSLLSLVNKIML